MRTPIGEGRNFDPPVARLDIPPELRQTITIDTIPLDDEDQLRNYFSFVFEEYGGAESHELKVRNMTSTAALYDYFKKNINDPAYPHHELLVLKDGQNIIGGSELHVRERDGKKYATITGDVIASQYRGKNLGPLLVSRQVEDARSLGCESISMGVNRKQFRALRSAVKGGLLVTNNHIDPERLKMVLDNEYYYLKRDLKGGQDNGASGQNEYDTQTLYLRDEDAILQALADGWEGYDVALNNDTQEESVMFLRKLKSQENQDNAH